MLIRNYIKSRWECCYSSQTWRWRQLFVCMFWCSYIISVVHNHYTVVSLYNTFMCYTPLCSRQQMRFNMPLFLSLSLYLSLSFSLSLSPSLCFSLSALSVCLSLSLSISLSISLSLSLSLFVYLSRSLSLSLSFSLTHSLSLVKLTKNIHRWGEHYSIMPICNWKLVLLRSYGWGANGWICILGDSDCQSLARLESKLIARELTFLFCKEASAEPDIRCQVETISDKPSAVEKIRWV